MLLRSIVVNLEPYMQKMLKTACHRKNEKLKSNQRVVVA